MPEETDVLSGSAVLSRDTEFVLAEPINEHAGELEKTTQLRKKLGLSDNSPLIATSETRRQDKARLKEYLDHELEERLEAEGGFIDRNKSKRDERRERDKEHPQGRVDKAMRRIAIVSLQRRGVSNAEEMLSTIEERDPFIRYHLVIKTGAGLQKLADLSPEELGSGIDRIEALGFHVGDWAFEYDEFVSAVREMAKIPEKDFENVCGQLNKYFFLKTTFYPLDSEGGKVVLSPDLISLADVFRTGGLTKEQKEILDGALKLKLLRTSPHAIFREDLSEQDLPRSSQYYSSDNVSNILARGRSLDEIPGLETVLDEEVHRFLRSGREEKYAHHYHLFELMRDLSQDGSLRQLADLAHLGFDLSPITAGGVMYRYGVERDEAVAKVKEEIRECCLIAKDRVALSWVALFEELRGEQQVPLDAEVVRDLYENREVLSQLAVFLHSLPGEDAVDFSDVVLTERRAFSEKLGERVVVDFSPLKEKLEVSFPDITVNEGRESDQYYHWVLQSLLHKRVQWGPLKMLPFLTYIAERKDYVRNYFDAGGKPTGRIISAILDGDIVCDPVLACEQVQRYRLGGTWLNEEKQLPITAVNRYLRNPQRDKRIIRNLLDSVEGKQERSELEFPQTTEGAYWQFYTENPMMREFIAGLPVDEVVQEGNVVDESALKKKYFESVLVTPRNCSTFRELTNLFNSIRTVGMTDQINGAMYMRIAAAHINWRLTVDQRTEVEDIDHTVEAFSRLYDFSASQIDKAGWNLLRRQLPFTPAGEEIRTRMRTRAVAVEEYDSERLGWVHESTHNYASIYQLPYMEAFRNFLLNGERSELDRYRARFNREAQAPEFTDADRKALLDNPGLIQELDQLISDTRSFYEISPQDLEESAEACYHYFDIIGDKVLHGELSEVVDSVKRISETEKLQTYDQVRDAVRFGSQVNNVRLRLLNYTGTQNNSAKVRLLRLDAILDGLSQKVFTQYKDYLSHQSHLSPAGLSQAAMMLYETYHAAYLNGEISAASLSEARRLWLLSNPSDVSDDRVHSLSLFLPIIQETVDSDWRSLLISAQQSMVDVLEKAELTREEAEAQVVHQDFIEFKKSSALFVVEPLHEAVANHMARFKTGSESQIDVGSEYEALLPSVLVYDRDVKSDVIQGFIENLRRKKVPQSLEEVHTFFRNIENRPEHASYILARSVVPEFCNEEGRGVYTTIEKNGHKIEIFPVTYYGVNMAVVIVDGQRVDRPDEAIMKEFDVVKAARGYLRQGD